MPLDRHLVDAFGGAAPEHHRWQTGAPVVADAERSLVEAAFLPPGRRILDLPFASGRFDQVLARDVVHHVPDAAGLLAECRRVRPRAARAYVHVRGEDPR